MYTNTGGVGSQSENVEGQEVEKKDEEDKLEEEGSKEEVVLRRKRTPGEPTPEERANHDLSHTPYRSWCPFCVAGRARDEPHMRAKGKDGDGEYACPSRHDA